MHAAHIRRGGSRWIGVLVLCSLPGLLAVGTGHSVDAVGGDGAAADSNAVAIVFADTSGIAGDIFNLPIRSSDLTGLGVFAYEFEITWNGSRFTVLDVETDGSLSANWSHFTLQSGNGTARVAASGAEAIAGEGTLLFLRLQLGPTTGGTGVLVSEFTLNEGDPAAKATNGLFTVHAPPAITIQPDEGELAVGDTLVFTVSGGAPTYAWDVTDPVVASMSSGGVLTGLAGGTTRVTVVDGQGIRDTTDSDIIVRPLALRAARDEHAHPGETVNLPLTVTSLDGLDPHSFQVRMIYNRQRLEILEAVTAGTLTHGWGPIVLEDTEGAVAVAAAGSTPLSGEGTLLFLRCRVPDDAPQGLVILDLQDGQFDEGILPHLVDGRLTVELPPAITITPNSADVLVGDTQAFNAQGSPTPPLFWGSTNPNVGTVDETGLFTALRGGSCRLWVRDAMGARDSSGIVSVSDLLVDAPDDTVFVDSGAEAVAIGLDRSLTGMGIHAFELTLRYNRTILEVVAVTDSGAITSPWGQPTYRIFADSIRVAHAGSAALVGNGPLLHIYFRARPDAPLGSMSPLTFQRLRVNEGSPVAMTDHGSIRIDALVPVRLAFFDAVRRGSRAIVRWQVTSAHDHAGFYLHSRLGRGDRLRLSDNMLRGRIAYEFTDPTPSMGEVEYWLEEIDVHGTSTWLGPALLPPGSPGHTRAELMPIRPNPGQAPVSIAYYLPASGNVRLRVFDAAGHWVTTLVDTDQIAGEHTTMWLGRDDEGRDVASGVYFIGLDAAGRRVTSKVVVAR